MVADDDAPRTNEGARRAIREFLESVHNDDHNIEKIKKKGTIFLIIKA